MFIEISDNLKKLSKFFPENLYVVGGYVRNKLMSLQGGDVDLASSVDIEEVSKRLSGSEYSVKIKNLKTGSLLISKDDESFEYTAFRKEEYGEGGSHSPVKVENTDKIEEDAQRRDFSVNAIYYNVNKDEVVDFSHGIIDLAQKTLRCENPEKILQNDGERILRMVRIAGELDFKIEKKTFLTAKKYAKNIQDLQGERKFAELEKILYCDKRYGLGKGSFKRALKFLNDLGVWKFFGLNVSRIRYKMTKKTQDRFLGLLIDIVDAEKPECLESFLERFLKEQFAIKDNLAKKIFVYLAGYYDALHGIKNKEYFFKYYADWAYIYPLLGCKSKGVQTKYNFFYQYIIEHGLVIEKADLNISENDIGENFPQIDERSYDRILSNLLSKVFDGKIINKKENLLEEIGKNLTNY